MATETPDLAERIAWGRARAATAMAMIFVAAQAISFHDELPLDHPMAVRLSAWIVWAFALLVFLAASGGLLRGPRIRAMLNDESTRDHRRRAMVWGFWSAILTAFLVYAASFFGDVTAREAVRLVITFAIAIALLRFGRLERRALKSG